MHGYDLCWDGHNSGLVKDKLADLTSIQVELEGRSDCCKYCSETVLAENVELENNHAVLEHSSQGEIAFNVIC